LLVMRRRKLGILGGTFDPIHVGHLSVAQQVGDRLGLDRVVLVPSGRPPHKDCNAVAPARDRLEMARLAVRGLARLSVSDIEVRRAGPSYTIDTVRQLRSDMGEDNDYWFVIGADTVAELPTWHRATELLQEIRFAVAVRPGCRPDFAPVEENLGPEAAMKLRRAVLDIEPCDVSSTEIRRRLAHGEDVGGMIRANVAALIRRRNLYAGAAPSS